MRFPQLLIAPPSLFLLIFFSTLLLRGNEPARTWFVDPKCDTALTGPNERVYAMALDAQDNIIVGGLFTEAGSISRRGIARFHTDGSLDTAFDPGGGIQGGLRTYILDLVLLEDESVVAVGDFTGYDSHSRGSIVKIQPDGRIDSSFASGSGSDSKIQHIALLPDGTFLIGGHFNRYDGVQRRRVARLHSDGSLDPYFDPGSSFPGSWENVDQIKVLEDGRILLAGSFDSYQGHFSKNIVRVWPDGAVDETFRATESPGNKIEAMLIQEDGKILLGGDGWSEPLLRLQPDGDLDPAFDAQLSGHGVYGLYETADGRIVVGGDIISGDSYDHGVVVLDADGRLNPDTFSNGIDLDWWVSHMLADQEGGLFISGAFESIDGTPYSRLARIDIGSTSETAEPTVSFLREHITVVEGEDGEIPLILNMEADYSESVELVLESDSPEILDDLSLWTTAYFSSGERYTHSYLVVGGNSRIDGTREVRVRIESASGYIEIGEPSALTVTILDDNVPGTVFFDRDSYALREEIEQVAVTLRRFENDPGELTIRCRSVDGSAVAGSDYFAVDEIVVFPDGVYERTLVVQGPPDDDTARPGRDFSLELIALDNITVGEPGVAIVTVNDKDDAGSAYQPFSIAQLEERIRLSLLTFDRGRNLYCVSDNFIGPGEGFIYHIWKFTPDGQGEIFASTPPLSHGAIKALKVAPDGSIYAFGPQSFRFDADGSPHSNWTSPSVYRLNSAEILADGRFVVAGRFNSVDGHERVNVARFFPDGTLDLSFNAGLSPATGAYLHQVLIASTGKVFVTSNQPWAIARREPDGAPDSAFRSLSVLVSERSGITHLAELPDGRLMIVVQGSWKEDDFLYRTYSDGSFDGTFDPVRLSRGYLRDLAIQPDGKVILALSRTGVVNGEPTIFARFNADGSRDSGFQTWMPNGTVETCVLGPDGTIYVSGSFTEFDGLPVPMIAAVKGGDGTAGGIVQWEQSDFSARRADGTIDLRIGRALGMEGDIGVTFSTLSGTALPGLDYVHLAGFVTFGAGETSRSISVDLLDHAEADSARHFQVVLHNALGGALVGERFAAQVTVLHGTEKNLEPWMARYFPDSSGDPSILLADSSGNGLANLYEFMTNTDPRRAGDGIRPFSGVVSLEADGGEDLFLSISFYYDPEKQGIRTIIEESASLDQESWATAWDSREDPAMISENLLSVPENGAGWVTLRSNTPLGSAGFLRLRYSLDP